jgi:NAD-dependent deacetylase
MNEGKGRQMMDNLILQAAQRLATARRVVASTGAGVSRESGVPTFRDAMEGLWAKYDPTQLATPEAFRANPRLVWDFYAYRRDLVRQTQPNPGHHALVELEALVPHFALITQNVDQHHQTAGSRDIIPLHGNLFAFKCSLDCQGSPTPIAYTDPPADSGSPLPPPCPHCGRGLVRPDVVWFGETLPIQHLSRAFEEAQSCDVMLVIGTSGAVYPAAQLPIEALKAGATVIEINPQPSELTPHMSLYLPGPSGEVLPKLVAALRQNLADA